MASSSSAPYTSPNHRPPASITELAERAKASVWDPDKPLKHWLRTAEGARAAGKTYTERGDLENAFLELAKAATIVLEKMPTHKDYKVLLSSTQRHNMGQHGQKILDDLANIKKALIEQYENWTATHSASSSSAQPSPYHPTTPGSSLSAGVTSRNSYANASPRSILTGSSSASTQSSVRSRGSTAPTSAPGRGPRTPSPYRQGMEDDEAARRARDDVIRRDSERRREENRAQHGSGPASAPPRRNYQEDWALAEKMRLDAEREEAERKREEEARRRIEDMRITTAEQRRQETEGITRRQQESDAAARAARGQDPAMPQPAIALAMPAAARASSSTATSPFLAESGEPSSGFLQMPLESPTRGDPAPRPSRTPVLPPMTTTSPPPRAGIQYPSLMSQHQMKQGYTPSLGSMFHQPAMQNTQRSSSGLLLFPSEPSSSSGLYANILPRPSMPTPSPGLPYGEPSNPQSHRHGPSSSGRAPPLPPKEPYAPNHSHSSSLNPHHQRSESSRIQPGTADPVNRDLKVVSFPRDCLNRFLSIAAINTSRNRETCGLLLGKDKGSRYLVTTLLIPKQHSTSDTCTMDEEELVMQFTEERSLITLGWIHTHPTQSCFMSSVDLHTHSGFQRMLPESFAVVCAPKSTPNFGIFRLTDPPGLQTILDCKAKEAFHPHPSCPIYTDADKGHVQIKDLALEIVDLR